MDASTSQGKIAVLFARKDSVYKTIPECDVYDQERDALTWLGGVPAICHPPCRLWGRLRQFSTAPIEEKQLAIFAVDQVRKHGGILEHPSGSSLWDACNLPHTGKGKDKFDGWTLAMPQFYWGHKANKSTWFYIVGINPKDIPEIPFVLGEAQYSIGHPRAGIKRSKPEISKAEREHTPIDLAKWLVDLAIRIKRAQYRTRQRRYASAKDI